MKSLIFKPLYKSLFKSKKDKCSYNSVDKKKIFTIKDLVIEAAKTYKTSTYIRYKIENEIQNVSFQDMLSICEIYTAWMYKEIEDVRATRSVHVGLLGIGSFNYYVAYLATIFSGNVTVPMDPNMDMDTLVYCINHGDIDVIFYESKFQEKINILKEKCPNVKHFILTEKNDDINPQNMDNILKTYKGQQVIKKVKPGDNALMIYTSGTTGKKKGVMLTHDNLVDKFFSTFNFKGNVTEIYLTVLPLYHIFSINDFLFSLRYGFTVCFDFNLSKLVENLQLFQPTKISLVPLLAKNLLNLINMNIKKHPELTAEEAKHQIVGKNFYKIQSGGGYLAPELTEGFSKLGILIGQGYGLTETASKGTLSDFNPKKSASIGKPAPFSQIRIQNGEIQIKSRAVMKEYYKDPERTKEAFTDDGWLHTGDIGYFDKDGYLYLVGRTKNLIILSNGENISPEKLETLYISEPLIQEVIVYGYEDVLCAEVYPNFTYAETVKVTKENLKESIWNIIESKNKDLPSYEKIVRLTLRDTPFPKTPSKKIIRDAFMKELEEREKVKENEIDNEVEYMKPANETQEKLYDIISEALGHQKFGVNSDLYSCGLDSFSCTIIMNRIRKEFNIPITLNYVVHNSSVIKLEKYLKEYKIEEDKDQIELDLSHRDVYPLSISQKISIRVFGGFTQGNIPCLFKLHEDIDLEKLKKSVEKLIDINYELKGKIHKDENGEYMNFRHDDAKADIPIIKLTDEEWEKTKNTITYPYGLTENELLYHIQIYQTESHNYLYLDISHLMCDGISFKNLVNELNDIYCGKEIPKKDYSFYEYVLEGNQRYGLKELVREKKEYQDRLLDGLTLRDNPFMRKDAVTVRNPESNPYHDADFIGTYEKIDYETVHAFCKEHNVTENVLFLVAATHALNLYEDLTDCTISSLHSGRTTERWNRVCGYVANFFQFRNKEIENETVIDSLHRAGKQIMETMCNYYLYIQRNTFFFQYQGDMREFTTLGGKPVEKERVHLDSTFNYVSVYKSGNKFVYFVDYWDNLYDTNQLINYVHIIEDVVVGIISGAKYIKDLRSYISNEYFTNERSISVNELNEAIGQEFITTENGDAAHVNIYILDRKLNKQLIGGWGDLYIEESPYFTSKECIDNPFGEGKLYKTGYTGKLLPDENKTLNILENDCKFVMLALLGFERYQNINVIEKELMKYEGIEKAEAKIKFLDDKFYVVSYIYGKEEPDMTKVNEYLKEKIEDERILPKQIIFQKLEQ